MNIVKTFILVISIFSIVGCKANFVRPDDGALVVGKSTRADVIKLLGNPYRENDNKKLNGEIVHTVKYHYVEEEIKHNTNTSILGNISTLIGTGRVVPGRMLQYTFFNGVMVGEEFNSTIPPDSTVFDTRKLSNISKGKSTVANVIKIFGRPSGEIIYPVMKDKIGVGIIYSYTITKDRGFARPSTNYLLTFTLDDKRIVSGISYKIDGEEQQLAY